MSDWNSKIVTALYTFFSGFGLPSYPEGAVPDDDEYGNKVEPPYITYEVRVPPIWQAAPLHAHIYYRSSSYNAITAKADEIYTAITEDENKAIIQFDGGNLQIGVDDDVDFLQFMPMPGDPTLKNAYLTMVMQKVTG